MDKKAHMLQNIEHKIDGYVNSLLPHGAGTLTESRLRHVLNQVAQLAFREGQGYALLSLMTIDEALEEINRQLQAIGREPISKRRLQAIARNRHDRFAIGLQIGNTGVWLFRPEEIESLIPGKPGRPHEI